MKPYGFNKGSTSSSKTCPCCKMKKYDRTLSKAGKSRRKETDRIVSRGAKKSERARAKKLAKEDL